MSGAWEFPGGKIEPAETARQALDRELAEELGIEVLAAELVLRLAHEYPDRQVELEVFAVSASRGRPRAREAQTLRWASVAELKRLDLLAADRPIIEWLAGRLNTG